jgi:hypothetical protein
MNSPLFSFQFMGIMDTLITIIALPPFEALYDVSGLYSRTEASSARKFIISPSQLAGIIAAIYSCS